MSILRIDQDYHHNSDARPPAIKNRLPILTFIRLPCSSRVSGVAEQKVSIVDVRTAGLSLLPKAFYCRSGGPTSFLRKGVRRAQEGFKEAAPIFIV